MNLIDTANRMLNRHVSSEYLTLLEIFWTAFGALGIFLVGFLSTIYLVEGTPLLLGLGLSIFIGVLTLVIVSIWWIVASKLFKQRY